MNGISKGKKHSSNAERGSFKSFVSAEKARLATAYPFLSPSQINGKIKKKWKMLDHKERKKFSKKGLNRTPSKGRNGRKAKRSSAKQKNSLDVCDTPENVNLHRLRDFRKQHKEFYKNDFGADKNSSHTLLLPRQTDGSLQRVSNGNDAEAKEMDTSNSESPDLDMDESDEDNDGVLIRRTDLDEYSDTEDNANAVEELCSMNNRVESVTTGTNNENNSGTKGKDFKNISNFTAPNDFVDYKKSTIMMMKDKAAENPCDYSSDDILFKSPGPKGSASKNCSGRKKRHSAPPTSLPAVLTPLVINSNEETEKYTTPQMDEVLQKLTIHEVNKAPQKRRHSYESVDTMEKVKATISGRRVTRSLLALQSELNETVEENLEDSGVSEGIIATVSTNKQALDKQRKNAKLSLRNKKNLGIKDRNNNDTNLVLDEQQTQIQDRLDKNKTKSEEINSEKVLNDTLMSKIDITENTLQMNPSGDASQTDQENMEDNLEKQSGVIDDIHDDNNNKGDSKKRLKRKFKIKDSDQIVKRKKEEVAVSTEECRSHGTKMNDDQSSGGSQSSLEFASSPASSSSRSFTPLRKSYRYTNSSNPTLERVLEGLRSTRVTSPTWSCSNSNVSSPRLLSPALSGVSELSSLSDQCSSEKAKQHTEDCIKTIKSEEDRDLCDLFKDVTPPELKTKGLYKTSRMLKSGNQTEKSDFQQLFQNEKDTIFI